MAQRIPRISSLLNNFNKLVLSFLIILCSSTIVKSFNFSLNDFAPAVATFYGPPNGAGSTGGACGYEVSVERQPYSSFVSAGNDALWKNGQGCGECYQVKCTSNAACSGNAITVTITDQCPGCSDPIHFDLSGTALGALAKSGQGDQLRNAGRVNIQFQRVPCNYGSIKIQFRIDRGANLFFLAFEILFEGGDGDLSLVEVQPSGSGFQTMQQIVGASYKLNSGSKLQGPFSVRLTTLQSKRSIVAQNVIPADFKPGNFYQSTVNF